MIGEGESTGGGVTLDSASRVIDGWMHNDGQFSNRFGGFPVFTRVVFDEAPEELGLWTEAGISASETAGEGVDVGGYARFALGTTTVVARIGGASSTPPAR